MSFPKDLFSFAPIPKEVVEHFSSKPWCRPLLENNSLRPFFSETRTPKDSTADTFTTVTLRSPDTIPFVQYFYSPPSSSRPFGEVDILLSLGSHVNGHIDTAHGGFIGSSFDDMMYCTTATARTKEQAALTVYLNVTYKRPIKTPGIVLGKCWMEKKEKRKVFGKATIEDGEGVVLATADALFIVVGGEKLRGKL